MESDAEARRYPYISWRPITHLFWGRFAFKVETTFPARGFRPIVTPLPPKQPVLRSSLMGEINHDRQRYQRMVAKFRKACHRFVPEDRTCWKTLETDHSFHFYFANRFDMLRFIAGNARKIRTVYAPLDDTDIERLLDAKHTYLRPTLFFDAFPFKVLFRMMPPAVVEELDEWVGALFSTDDNQIKYNAFGTRCLYLKNENDILLTRLAFSRYILRVERVILRSDILHACHIGETTGGEGGDPPVHRI